MNYISDQQSIIILYFSSILSFILTGFYCFYKDMYASEERYSKNKIQKSDKSETLKTYKKCLPLVISNLFIVIPIICYFLYPLSPNKLYEHSDIYKLPINIILIDILFYITHRIMHYGILYRKFHKKHHEINKPVSISALYLHPVDLIFSNFFPVVLPPYILNQGVIAYSFWLIFSLFNTVYISHQGIKNLSEFHDYHHQKSKYNYGSELFMDKLFGTFKSS